MRLTLLIIIILTQHVLLSQEYTFERINSDHGLSQNVVVDIFQDSRGFLWLATHEGMNRYDGLEFKTYSISQTDSNSITSNLSSKFAEDSKGNIWVTTLDKGVCRFNPETEEFTRFYNTEKKPDLLRTNHIRNIFCDSLDRVFIATKSGVECIIQNKIGEFNVIHIKNPDDSLLNDESVLCTRFHKDKSGKILVCMWDKIAYIDFPEDNSYPPRLKPFFENNDIHNIHIISDFQNGYIIGHDKGLSYIHADSTFPYKEIISSIDIGRVMKFTILNDGTIWSGSDNGLYRLKFTDKKFTVTHHFTAGDNEYSIPSNNVVCVSKDNTGNIWVGTNGGGICKLSSLNRQFRTYKSTLKKGSLSYNKILSIHEDNEKNVWIGTEGGGVNYLPAHSKQNYSSGFKKYYYNIPDEQHIVFDLCNIKSDTPEIWMGTAYQSKIVRFIKSESDWKLSTDFIPEPDGMVMSIHQDKNNAVWLGTYLHGLYKITYNNGSITTQHYTTDNSNICSNTIRSFYEDSKGRLWIGTSDGLMVLNRIEMKKNNPEFHIFKNIPSDNSSLSYNYILRITEANDSSIWFGTMGGGLNKYIEGSNLFNGSFERFSIKNGLANNSIKEIVADNDGNFWLGTNKGLTKFNPVTYKIRNFNRKDGLQGSEFIELAGCKRHDGEILMGGINGFNAFYPEDITEDTTPPKIVFTKLEIANKEIKYSDTVNGDVILSKPLNLTDKIILRHADNNFTIHFAALHMSNPEYNRYNYKLEGYDSDWIPTSAKTRFAKYTNLKEGKYTFKVKASNSDGYWIRSPRSVEIIIKPAFYQTTLFKISAILFIAIIITIALLLRLYTIKNQKEILESIVEERTFELMEQNVKVEESKEEIIVQKEALEKKSSELEYHKNNLERIVNKRTEALKLALEDAKKADMLKSAFLANMSHEIRTPMNAIIGFTSLLDEDFTDEEKSNFMNLIQSNSQKLLMLIDDILSISLIESNQLKINISEFNIISVLDKSILTARMNSNGKEIDHMYNNNTNTEVVLVKSDELRINQIITNLLDNAYKFTESGSITLNSEFDNNNNLVISIADTGIGIAKENIDSIFDRFNKIDSSSSPNYSGVGLGLSISHKLSQLLNCKIWVESELDKGSEFFLMIPADQIANS